MDPVQFNRQPYKVTYYKDGEKHVINRRPPPKLHGMWPKDVVELNTTRNADWQKGDTYTVKGINPKHPNTIQIENSDGEATFVAHFDLDLKESRGGPDGIDPKTLPINNRYLTWP